MSAKRFYNFAKETIEYSFSKYFELNSLKVIESNIIEKVPWARNVTLMLVTHSKVTLFFKLSYDYSKLTDDISKKKEQDIDDLMKELCNVIGGSIKNIFNESFSKKLQLGLPFKITGFDNLYFWDDYSDVVRKDWEIYFNGALVLATVEIVSTSDDWTKSLIEKQDTTQVDFF